MKPGRLITAAMVALFMGFTPFSAAMSQEREIEASIGVEGRLYEVNGSKAKAHEYSDTRSGFFSGADVKYDSPGYFFRFLGQDMGYDTQHYRLDGGAYGKFKYFFDYNETIHNLTTDARTFYTGAGSGTLADTPNANPNSWSTFDYYTKRKKFDTGVSFDIARPFFFDVSFSNEQKEGVKPTGVSSNTPAGPSLELPQPIDFTTNNFKVEGGYSKKPFFLSFSYLYSEFRNRNQDLTFTTPAGGLREPLSMAPDNTMHRFALKGSAKLPFNSKFSVNLKESKATSSTDSFAAFDGKVDTSAYDFAVTSNPVRFLDVKLFYKYYERDNKSSGQQVINLVPTPATPFYYQTDTFGAELGLRLPAKLYLNGGYKYIKTNRKVQDQTDPTLTLPHNKDNIYFADLKWSGLDFMQARVGYERLERDADYQTIESQQVFNRKYAYAAQNRDTFKAAVDLFPLDELNIGLEYRYKKAQYNDVYIGFKNDTRNAFSFNADYALKKFARLYGYFDYEEVAFESDMITGLSRWDGKQEEKTYGYGIRADLYVIPKKLTFILQHDYVRNMGTNDFTFYDNTIWGAIGVPAGSTMNITNADSYQKYSYRFTAAYNYSNSLMLRVGYAYERYIYSDSQFNNYPYFSGGPGNSTAYLTGAYASPNYSANVLFGGLTYRF